MKLLSAKTKRIICKNVVHAKTFSERSRGLIDSDGKHGLYTETRLGIHTFGLKFPIDVIILGADGRVVKTKYNLRPNRFFFWNPKYKRVIEIPSKIHIPKIATGDKLKINQAL